MRKIIYISHNKLIATFILAFFGSISILFAQDKYIKASAPAVVNAGSAFNYVIKGNIQASVNIYPPTGIRIIGGPSQMVSYRSSNINGRMQSTKEVSYTYVLIADREGDYVIPAAVVKSGRKEYKSNEIRIKAVSSSASTSGTASGESPSVILQLVPSKRSVYQGEQIVISSKVLVREQLQITGLKAASYEGFWTEELKPDDFARNETLDSYNYRTQVIKRDLLTAQQKGEIKIGPSIMDVTIQKRVKGRNSFFDDPFFDNAFGSYENVAQSVKSNVFTVNVKALPSNAPESFTGAVGNFKISANLSKDSVDTNDAISLKIKYSGKGNLNLISAPKIDFPLDLEVFEPKRVANIKHEESGTSGSVSFEYVLIPRHPGNYRISPVEQSFFNPKIGRYDMYISNVFEFIATGELAGEEGGDLVSNGFFREGVADLNTDIVYIKTSEPILYESGVYLIQKLWIYLYFGLGILFLFASYLLWRRKLEKESDIFYTRNKKAWKIARKRLKVAREMLKKSDEGIYEEILRGVEAYLADRLGMNKADLSRENIKSALEAKAIPEETLNSLWLVMDDCEFARYSTGETADKAVVFENAVKCLTDIEQNL